VFSIEIEHWELCADVSVALLGIVKKALEG